MRCLSITFFFAIVFCSTAVSAIAQNISYLDVSRKPATATNYTYKRVIKYVKPILDPNFGTGYYDEMTSNPQPSGLHVCSLTEYYKTGEVALVGNIVAIDYKCSGWGFDGQVVNYYTNGNIAWTTPYKNGKRNGIQIFYNSETGNEIGRKEYVNDKLIERCDKTEAYEASLIAEEVFGGKPIERGKFCAPANSPVTGTWKYTEYVMYESILDGVKRPIINQTATFTYSQDGVVESVFRDFKERETQRNKGNWKYTPKTDSSGILEEFLGEDLVERATVKFSSRNQLEYTITFSKNSDAIGKQYTWTRQ